MSDPQYSPGLPPGNYVQYQQDVTPAEPDMIPFPFDEVLEIKTSEGTFVLSQPREAIVMLQRDVPNQLLFRENDPPSQQPAAPVDDDWFKDWSDRAEQASKLFEAGKAGVEFGTAAAPVFTSIFNVMKKKNGAPKSAPTKTAKYQPASYAQAPASSKYYPSNPGSHPVSTYRPGSSGTHVSATTPTRTSYERSTKYDGYSNLPPPPLNRPSNTQNLRPGSTQNTYPAYPQASSRPTSSGSHHQNLKPATQSNYGSYGQNSRPTSSSGQPQNLKPLNQGTDMAHQHTSSRPTSAAGSSYVAYGNYSASRPQGYVQNPSSHPVAQSSTTRHSSNHPPGYIQKQSAHANYPSGLSNNNSNRLSAERTYGYKVSPVTTPTRTSFNKPRPSAEYVTASSVKPGKASRPPPPSAFENNFAKPLRRQSTLGKTFSGFGKLFSGPGGKKR